jgi:hypothetical protein
MSEETYQAVKAAYRSYGAFLKDLVEEIGWEKVLQIRQQVGIRTGESAVQFFRKHDPETRLAEFGKMSADWYNKSGWVMTTKATSTVDEAHIQTCPIFDGFTEAGLSVEQVNDLCNAVHRGIDMRLKQDFPDAEFTSILKKSKEKECIEKFTVPT